MIFSGRLQRDPNTSQVWYSNDFNSGVLLSLLRGTSQDKKRLGQKMFLLYSGIQILGSLPLSVFNMAWSEQIFTSYRILIVSKSEILLSDFKWSKRNKCSVTQWSVFKRLLYRDPKIDRDLRCYFRDEKDAKIDLQHLTKKMFLLSVGILIPTNMAWIMNRLSHCLVSTGWGASLSVGRSCN